MSDCGVCLYGSDSDCDYYIDEVSEVVLLKDQCCSECRKLISAGQKMECATKFSDYDEEDLDPIETKDDDVYTCLVCAEIANAFHCDMRMYGGQLWEDMADVFDQFSVACLDRLTTPIAKAEMQRRWMKWKGLSA